MIQEEKDLLFNSSICTSLYQSERLIKLGLKKETADMCYKVTTHDFRGNEIGEKDRHYSLCTWYDESNQVCGLEKKETIPAWSLHRLLCLINKGHIKFACNEHSCWGGSIDNFNDRNVFKKHNNVYDNICNSIEWLIEKGDINKEYLKHDK
jgi:hypothetical protein